MGRQRRWVARGDGLRSRVARINFARLNHILIPSKKPDRDRLRRGLLGKVLAPTFWFVSALSREGQAFVVLMLLIGAAGVDVSDSDVFLLFSGMIGLLIGAFAIRPFYRLDACRIDVGSPERVRAHEAQSFTITVVNSGARDLTSLRVERPFLPWDGRWIGEPLGLAVVPAGQSKELRTTAVFVERGEHHLDAFEIAALVPLGLAVGKRVSSPGCRFLVVPRPATVTAVSIERAQTNQEGRRVARSRMGGDEIVGVRPYRRGDPLKHLHVRTWARTGAPHVRQYVQEESEGVMVVVALDGSDAPEPRIEAAISLVAGIAAALASGDIGVDYLVTGGAVLHVEPRRGRAALDFILEALAKLEPSKEPTDELERAREIAPSVATAIVVAADGDPRRAALREGIAAAGIPAKAFEVVEDGGASVWASAIEVSRIVKREPIAC
jgi:uncharacterized protein (DUF58 family)